MKTISLARYRVFEGSLILINASFSYHDTVKKILKPIDTDNKKLFLEKEAADAFLMLMSDIGGWKEIAAVSGWRSINEQHDIFSSSLIEKGLEFTQKYVAFPGYSEHQSGLAIDLGLRQSDIDYIRPSFPYSGICKAFKDKAAHYGFIERYPKGKEGITNIAWEPWHFRYVGCPHAEIITKLDLTFEEYHDFLKQYEYGRKSFKYANSEKLWSISYMKACAESFTNIEGDPGSTLYISGNNSDGFILTELKNKQKQ